MQREPNPYAQQRTYTVTQTMAISVPSIVAEDVLDGEDMGGGGSNLDSSALVVLQSDMVELKSDVATLETNVSNLTQTTIPAISASTTAAQQKADSALQKSQVTWLTTPDYNTSKLQITSGDGLEALSLTTNGNTSTVYDLVKSAAPNIKLEAPISSLQFTEKDTHTLLMKAAYDRNPSALTYCDLVVNGIASTEDTNYRLRMSRTGIQTSTNAGSTWTNFSIPTFSNYLEKLNFAGDWDHGAIVVSGKFSIGDTGLSHYALAARAFANADRGNWQMKPVSDGIAYSNDSGSTWTTISSADIQGLSINGIGKLSFSLTDGAIVVETQDTDTSALSYYPLATNAFANVDSISCWMKPVSDGIAYSNDAGNTWTTMSVSNMAWLSDNASKLAALLDS